MDETGRWKKVNVSPHFCGHLAVWSYFEVKLFLNITCEYFLHELESTSVGSQVLAVNAYFCCWHTTVNLKLVGLLPAKLFKWKLTPSTAHLGYLVVVSGPFDVDNKLDEESRFTLVKLVIRSGPEDNISERLLACVKAPDVFITLFPLSWNLDCVV